jgi:hypothetical protein
VVGRLADEFPVVLGDRCLGLFNLTAVTMRQRQVPAALLGRVSSLYGTVGSGAEVLGAIGGRTGRQCRDPRPHARRAIPIAGVTTLLAWRHRAHDLPN